MASSDKPLPHNTAPNGPVYAFSRFCLRHRVAVLIVVLVGTVYLALAVAARLIPAPVVRFLRLPPDGITIDASSRAFVIQNDPDEVHYRRFLDRFGSDTMLAVGIECPGSCFDEAELRRILAVTRRLEQHHDVVRILSLATVIYPTADGRLADLSDLLAVETVDPAALDRFGEEMTANRIVRENLIARDVTAADGPYTTTVLFVAFLDELDDEDLVNRGTIDDIRAIVTGEVGEGNTVRLVGNPVLREALSRIITSDLFIFLGVTQLLAAAAVFGIFRCLRTVLIIMVLVWITLAWTFGIFVIAGYMMNLVTAILVPVLITVCVTIAVHIFVYYNEEAQTGSARHDAVLNTAWRMGRPCFLTSLTTAIGLGSLAANRIGPVQAFGIFGAAGTMLSFIFAFALLPMALAACGSPAGLTKARHDRHPVLQFLGRCSRVCVTHPWTTLIIAGVIAAAAILGITQLRVETRIISYFKQREPIVQAYQSFDRRKLGITSLEVMVTSSEPDVLSPDIQDDVRRFADFMTRQEHVASVICSAYYADERDRIRRELERDGRLSPREMLAAFAKAQGLTDGFVSPDRTSTRINIRLTEVTSSVLIGMCRTIEKAAAEFFDDSLDVHITGNTKLYTNVVGTLVSGQIRSIVLAFVAVTIVMAVVFRSLRIGLISMVPTMLPVLITLGMMGWVNVALNGATVMIASVAIGIVVDSAIHFLHRYRRERASARDFGTAINRTLLTVGQPISYAVLILSCAFIVLALGNFNPTNYFGILTAFTMLISLFITLLLLPVCLNLFHARSDKTNHPRKRDQ